MEPTMIDVDHGVAGSDKEAGHNIGSLVDDIVVSAKGKAMPKRSVGQWADESEEVAADTVAPSSGTRTPASTADITEAHTEVSDSEDNPEVTNSKDAAAATAKAPAAPAAAQQTDPEFRLEICKLCPRMADERASVFIKRSKKQGKLFLPTQFCKFYSKGCCTKGDCLYAHGLEEIHPHFSASAQERREEFHLHSGPEGSGEGYRVNVSNLACGVNADHLKTLFKKHGEVLHAKIQLKDGVCNGTGNVTFKTKEEARNAIAKLNTTRNVKTEEHLGVMVSAENKPLNVFVPPERQSPKVVPQMQQQQQQQQFYPCCWTGVWCLVPVYHPSMNQGGMM
jgi:hypothetical protein